MIDERVKWRCKGCDGECVVNCYPNNIEPCGCIYSEMGVIKWERIVND